MIHEAGAIPEAGQVFRFHGFRFEVLRKMRNRITSLQRDAGRGNVGLNSKRRNGPCNALILLIWGSDFSKTWCHVCMFI